MQTPRTTTAVEGGFSWTLGPSTGSITQARDAFRSWLDDWDPDRSAVEELLVVLSELASNAVTGAGSGPATIDASVDDGDLTLEVTNAVPPESAQIVRWDLDDPLRGGGRGLMIVRAYTDALEVRSVDGTVIVRCRRRLAP